MYTTALFRLNTVARHRLFGEDGQGVSERFRSLIASESDAQGIALPSALFHYGDDGRPLNNLAPVRFHATPTGLTLIGIGAYGRDLIYETGPGVNRILTGVTKLALPVEIREGQNQYKPLGFERLYHSSITPVGRRSRKNDWTEWVATATERKIDVMTIPEAKAAAETILTNSLRRQLLELHLNGPGDRTCVVDMMTGESIDSEEDLSRLKVRVVTTATVPVPAFGALQRAHARSIGAKAATMIALKRPVFAINAELKGEWAVGLLQARGYGRLRPHHEAETLEEATA